ncbi:hypothetical protein C7377_0775 [Balneicella halophila]|uniref:Thioredoxin-like protein n=1 Tax=Balneicella halophila TaxID=1537566 RepID=A0A7L4URQ5_BALHA|nr:hypothetical protein [Balneicella halophila]PVX52458.1 hypothetical protein C7377_0775 [Balneicella halophila]
MKKAWLVIFPFLVLITVGHGQTLIKIADKSYADIPLRIYAYDNLLSHTPQLLEEKTVATDGALSFSLNIRKPQLVYIPIYSFHLIFYAEPDKTLALKLPNRRKLEEAFIQLKSYSGREIPLFIENKNSLNQSISAYDSAFNNYLKSNFRAIYQKKSASEHIDYIEKLRSISAIPHLKSYATYKEAYLYYVSGEQNKIIETFYANKPLLLHNTAYVSLMKKLAKPIAEDFSQATDYRPLYKQLVANNSYSDLYKISKSITGTADIALNEHFFIYILHSGLQLKTIPPKVALKKLSLIAEQSNNKTNIELAESIISKFYKQFKGSSAPNFSLKATDGLTYNSSILKTNKPTLIAFFDGAVNNDVSIKTLQELQEKYSKFEVILFSATKSIDIAPNNWKQFVIPYHSYTLRDYRLGRFPYYVLVEKNGKISQQTWQQYLIRLEE